MACTYAAKFWDILSRYLAWNPLIPSIEAWTPPKWRQTSTLSVESQVDWRDFITFRANFLYVFPNKSCQIRCSLIVQQCQTHANQRISTMFLTIFLATTKTTMQTRGGWDQECTLECIGWLNDINVCLTHFPTALWLILSSRQRCCKQQTNCHANPFEWPFTHQLFTHTLEELWFQWSI